MCRGYERGLVKGRLGIFQISLNLISVEVRISFILSGITHFKFLQLLELFVSNIYPGDNYMCIFKIFLVHSV